MGEPVYDRLYAVFLQTFASVPDTLRKEIIIVVDGEPYTWETVFLEVKGKTKKAQKMMDGLKKLEIIR